AARERAELVDELPASDVVDSGRVEDRSSTPERAQRVEKMRRHFAREQGRAIADGLDQTVEDPEVAFEMAERDHRHAVADEGVVGVVPLGPLRVEPDAGAGN